ncbi:UNVERIFIED_CONTAM: putative late blight resistance proteinR1A-10 [Sesamum radiatum]|uniref:Late blight resistance proteinR1A-10 n=1 Tax=Sesamum radiatum TaxID=300843 RepID=A0AAW2RXS4_SESRA
MAYAAVISLKLTIQRLVESSQIPIPSPVPEIIELAYEKVESLQELFTLEDGSNNERVKAVEREIREAACRLEDALESAHVSNQRFLSKSQTLDGDEMNYLAMEVKEEISLFTETVEKIKEQFRNTLVQPEEYEEAIEKVIPSRTDHFVGMKSKIFGLDSDLIKLKDLLIRGYERTLGIVSIVGMAGIGKTTLAKEVYRDPNIFSHFDCCAFVSIGPEYRLREILLCILAQIHPGRFVYDKDFASLMYLELIYRRYLIVLDDVWNVKVWDELKIYFPNNAHSSRIMLTTRIEEVAHLASCYAVHKMRLLNEKDSWNLLCEKVFDEENSCPPQLEKAGKKIAEKCEGLPLAIIVIGRHLSKAEKTPKYWSKVAERECSNIIGADAEMSKVLYLSYKYLPQHLKACFLYMGVFPRDYEIPPSKLINLWCAEGFLEPNRTKTTEDHAMLCLEDLVSRSVVLVRQQSTIGRIKTCRLHSVFQHLCIQEASKDKFFHVLDGYANQGIESQRRFCTHNNVLFGIKDVYKSMASISNARSLLCTGAHHQYPVPMCLHFSLLRVLDALTIRFYSFPIELVKLIQLRYLSFTYNGKLYIQTPESSVLNSPSIPKHHIFWGSSSISAHGDLEYARIEASPSHGKRPTKSQYS